MADEKVLHLSAEGFGETIKSGVVLVDFWASWCGPCRMLGPVIDALAADYDGKAKVCKLNVDENAELASNYGVMGIPTVLIFKDGAEYARIVGLRAKDSYTEVLDKALQE